jgi:hypothetical protein
MERMRTRVAAALAALLAACGKGTTDPEPTLTFVPVEKMVCADGSSTGLGVSRGSEDVLLYLSPGGACSPLLCDASRGPFRAADLALAEQAVLPGTILDRQLAGNPFARFTLVVVPYCTGDVHAGDAVQDYGGTIWRHRGHANLEAAVEWIEANLPRPTRIVVAGSSAGGFGSLLAYDSVRSRWPGSSGVTAGLIDDSGPTFDPPGFSTALPYVWWDAWNLGSTVTPLCPGCKDRLSEIWRTLSGRYPEDLMALLSTTQDGTMSDFLELTSSDFEIALTSLVDTLKPLGNVKTFRVDGTDHALLRTPARYAAGGKSLLSWLDPIAIGTGAFTSAGP